MSHRETKRGTAEPHSRSIASPVANSEFEGIRALAATLQDLHQQQATALAPLVQNILHTRSRNACEIERTLDYLLDCACIPKGLALFKSLCRYYFTLNPLATANYVNIYREMWDSEVDDEMEIAEIEAELGVKTKKKNMGGLGYGG